MLGTTLTLCPNRCGDIGVAGASNGESDGDGLGAVDEMGEGDGASLGDGDRDGDGVSSGEGDGDGLGLGEGDGLISGGAVASPASAVETASAWLFAITGTTADRLSPAPGVASWARTKPAPVALRRSAVSASRLISRYVRLSVPRGIQHLSCEYLAASAWPFADHP